MAIQNQPEADQANENAAEARRVRQQQAAAKAQTPAQAPGGAANWQLSSATNNERNAQQGTINAIDAAAKARGEKPGAVPTDSMLSIAELMARNEATYKQADAVNAEQSARGGVEVGDATGRQGGIGGIFGGKEVQKRYTAGRTEDPNAAANANMLANRITGIENRGNVQAQAASMGPAAQMQSSSMQAANVDQSQANQFRAGQQGLVGMLGNAAAGNGPSAAQAQLQQATDQNLNAQLALAKSGSGNGSIAMKRAMMNQATIGQQAASQSAALRAQEQQQAQSALGGVLAGAREQDLGVASTDANLAQQASAQNATLAQQAAAQNANMQQQAAITDAGMQQQTNLANMQSTIEQQKQKDAMVAQFVAQGLTLDAAQRQAEIQQAQFNAELLVRQDAADKGISLQSSQAAANTGIAAIGAVASGIATAAASDKRAKKNIEDGDKSIERFLDSVRAKDWDYKDPKKHGEGRRTGIMAQDAEKHSDMVFTHKDGVKMLDLGKAASTSLAALANINKRLRQLEK